MIKMNYSSWMWDKFLSRYAKLLESRAEGPTSNNRIDSVFLKPTKMKCAHIKVLKNINNFGSILNLSTDKYLWRKSQCNGDKAAKNESRGWPSWWGDEGNTAGRVGSCWSQYIEQGFKNRKPKWKMSSPNPRPQVFLKHKSLQKTGVTEKLVVKAPYWSQTEDRENIRSSGQGKAFGMGFRYRSILWSLAKINNA